MPPILKVQAQWYRRRKVPKMVKQDGLASKCHHIPSHLIPSHHIPSHLLTARTSDRDLAKVCDFLALPRPSFSLRSDIRCLHCAVNCFDCHYLTCVIHYDTMQRLHGGCCVPISKDSSKEKLRALQHFKLAQMLFLSAITQSNVVVLEERLLPQEGGVLHVPQR